MAQYASCSRGGHGESQSPGCRAVGVMLDKIRQHCDHCELSRDACPTCRRWGPALRAGLVPTMRARKCAQHAGIAGLRQAAMELSSDTHMADADADAPSSDAAAAVPVAAISRLAKLGAAPAAAKDDSAASALMFLARSALGAGGSTNGSPCGSPQSGSPLLQRNKRVKATHGPVDVWTRRPEAAAAAAVAATKHVARPTPANTVVAIRPAPAPAFAPAFAPAAAPVGMQSSLAKLANYGVDPGALKALLGKAEAAVQGHASSQPQSRRGSIEV